MGGSSQTVASIAHARRSIAAGPDPKANFFLVGAPKAGTTSVVGLLRDHPDVFLSPIKEPCHFCPDVVQQLADRFRTRELDMPAYLAAWPRREVHLALVSSPHDYARLFERANGCKVVGECSTYYLSSEAAPGLIHAYNPNARILIVVRRPLDRIRSHYAMDRHLGFADRPLPSLVAQELAMGDAAHWGNCSYYVGASRYARQIAAFRRLFPPGAICVLSFERLVAGPEAELRRLFGFLGIALPEGPLALSRENPSRAARFAWLHHGLRKSGLKAFVAGAVRPLLETPAGRLIRSAYYRDKISVVSDDELHEVDGMLADSGVSREYDLVTGEGHPAEVAW